MGPEGGTKKGADGGVSRKVPPAGLDNARGPAPSSPPPARPPREVAHVPAPVARFGGPPRLRHRLRPRRGAPGRRPLPRPRQPDRRARRPPGRLGAPHGDRPPRRRGVRPPRRRRPARPRRRRRRDARDPPLRPRPPATRRLPPRRLVRLRGRHGVGAARGRPADRRGRSRHRRQRPPGRRPRLLRRPRTGRGPRPLRRRRSPLGSHRHGPPLPARREPLRRRGLRPDGPVRLGLRPRGRGAAARLPLARLHPGAAARTRWPSSSWTPPCRAASPSAPTTNAAPPAPKRCAACARSILRSPPCATSPRPSSPPVRTCCAAPATRSCAAPVTSWRRWPGRQPWPPP